jgi:basic membrane lipoprotein Med (substrate-binding protein (PBP1-ABC) superfamily)
MFRAMRLRPALIASLLLCVCAAGCGDTKNTTVQVKRAERPAALRTGLRVGVVGPLRVRVEGAVPERGRLSDVAGDALVLVTAGRVDPAALAASAEAHPSSHFALVGAPTDGDKRPNVLGLVLNEREAAELGGVVAGLVAGDQGGKEARVAWVGPEERALASFFARGAQDVRPRTTVLRAWSRDDPAACKEAALGAIGRGAVAIMAHGGSCAAAAIAGAHQQNVVGLRVADFELPEVAAESAVRDAVAGVYRGGEDIVFDAASGAIGVRRLDPRVPPDLAVRARTAAQDLAEGRRPSGR